MATPNFDMIVKAKKDGKINPIGTQNVSFHQDDNITFGDLSNPRVMVQLKNGKHTLLINKARPEMENLIEASGSTKTTTIDGVEYVCVDVTDVQIENNANLNVRLSNAGSEEKLQEVTIYPTAILAKTKERSITPIVLDKITDLSLPKNILDYYMKGKGKNGEENTVKVGPRLPAQFFDVVLKNPTDEKTEPQSPTPEEPTPEEPTPEEPTPNNTIEEEPEILEGEIISESEDHKPYIIKGTLGNGETIDIYRTGDKEDEYLYYVKNTREDGKVVFDDIEFTIAKNTDGEERILIKNWNESKKKHSFSPVDLEYPTDEKTEPQSPTPEEPTPEEPMPEEPTPNNTIEEEPEKDAVAMDENSLLFSISVHLDDKSRDVQRIYAGSEDGTYVVGDKENPRVIVKLGEPHTLLINKSRPEMNELIASSGSTETIKGPNEKEYVAVKVNHFKLKGNGNIEIELSNAGTEEKLQTITIKPTAIQATTKDGSTITVGFDKTEHIHLAKDFADTAYRDKYKTMGVTIDSAMASQYLDGIVKNPAFFGITENDIHKIKSDELAEPIVIVRVPTNPDKAETEEKSAKDYTYLIKIGTETRKISAPFHTWNTSKESASFGVRLNGGKGYYIDRVPAEELEGVKSFFNVSDKEWDDEKSNLEFFNSLTESNKIKSREAYKRSTSLSATADSDKDKPDDGKTDDGKTDAKKDKKDSDGKDLMNGFFVGFGLLLAVLAIFTGVVALLAAGFLIMSTPYTAKKMKADFKEDLGDKESKFRKSLKKGLDKIKEKFRRKEKNADKENVENKENAEVEKTDENQEDKTQENAIKTLQEKADENFANLTPEEKQAWDLIASQLETADDATKAKLRKILKENKQHPAYAKDCQEIEEQSQRTDAILLAIANNTVMYTDEEKQQISSVIGAWDKLANGYEVDGIHTPGTKDQRKAVDEYNLAHDIIETKISDPEANISTSLVAETFTTMGVKLDDLLKDGKPAISDPEISSKLEHIVSDKHSEVYSKFETMVEEQNIPFDEVKKLINELSQQKAVETTIKNGKKGENRKDNAIGMEQ